MEHPEYSDAELAAHVRSRFHIPPLDRQLARSEQQELLLASIRRQAMALLSYNSVHEQWEPDVRLDDYWAAAKREGVEWDEAKVPRLHSYLLDHHSEIDHTQGPVVAERQSREDEARHYLRARLLRVDKNTQLDWRSFLAHIYTSPSTTLWESGERFWGQFENVENAHVRQQLLTMGVPMEGIERGILEVRGRIADPPC